MIGYFVIICLPECRVQIYDIQKRGTTSLPKTKNSKVNSIRKDVRKGKKQACSAQGKAKGKETGKIAITTTIDWKSGQGFQYVDTPKGRVQLRSIKWKVPRSNTVRTPHKKRKEISKVERTKLSRPVQLPQFPRQHGATALHKLVSKKLWRTPVYRPSGKE